MKEAHPTHYKCDGDIWERNPNYRFIEPYSKEGMERQEASAIQHGRAWWWFTAVAFRTHRDMTWIEQFRVLDDTRNRKSIHRRKYEHSK
tara:strand:- start:88 stop:354 length:267 start_codon:yes stop_codon:yes gene_type:complete